MFYSIFYYSGIIRIVGDEEIIVFFFGEIVVLRVNENFNVMFEEVFELVVFYIDVEIEDMNWLVGRVFEG